MLWHTLVAKSVNATLSYVHQDSLTSTSLMTDSGGTQIGNTVKYLPFGEARAIVNVPTDKLFTGQRLDSTGLYYYNARYYDPTIGRFISADTFIQSLGNPQCLNRYSYCLNNPLKYTDPSGLSVKIAGIDVEDPSNFDVSIILQMNPEQQKEFFAAIQAWLEARKNAPTDTQKLIDSNTTFTIKFADINTNLDSIYESKSGSILINDDYIDCDSWWTGSRLLNGIYDAAETSFFPDFGFTSESALLAYDSYAVAGAAIALYGLFTGNPVALVWGTATAAWAGIGAMCETYNSFNAGNADGIDATVSWLTFLGGFAPGIGFFISIFQLVYDTQ
jgi:RHS repeat-associated protein